MLGEVKPVFRNKEAWIGDVVIAIRNKGRPPVQH